MDLSQLPDAADVIDDLAATLGGPHLLVNNAGRGPDAPFLDQTFEGWQGMLDVDLSGAFLFAQRAARRMVEAGAGGSSTSRAFTSRCLCPGRPP